MSEGIWPSSAEIPRVVYTDLMASLLLLLPFLIFLLQSFGNNRAVLFQLPPQVLQLSPLPGEHRSIPWN